MTITPETALAIFTAAMQIKRMLKSNRPDPDADFTDEDAALLLQKAVVEGESIIADWRSRPTPAPPGS